MSFEISFNARPLWRVRLFIAEAWKLFGVSAECVYAEANSRKEQGGVIYFKDTELRFI